MKTGELYHLYEQMNINRILFTYNGPVSQGILNELGAALERRNPSRNSPVSRKLFAILVELFQNIMHYSQEQISLGTRLLPRGIVVVGETESNYYVMAGNKVNLSQKQKIETIMMSVNNMSTEELKLFYKNMIHTVPEPTSKGGGLGFIDIARKSGYSLKYEFIKMDDGFFYSLKVLLDKGNTSGFYKLD